LALHGGSPIRERYLPYGRQHITEEDIEAVVQALRSDWLTTGPKVDEFEEAFAHYVGAKFSVTFSSGTAALHAATFAAGLERGDEAVTTPMTFCATANAVLYQGATPVFADVARDTLTIDPEKITKSLTARTKAILPVDYAGHPADLCEILEIAQRHGLTVIEDACHAVGAGYRLARVGSISHLTVFSFHPVKHITTGEGGMVSTNDEKLAARLRQFRNHGITVDHRARQVKESWVYDMAELGYNYRLSDLQCALGLAQLQKLPRMLARRQEIARQYEQALADLPELERPTVRKDRESAWHLYVIKLNLERLRVSREQVFRAMRAENIGVNVHYIPVPWHSYYQKLGYRRGRWPVAEAAYERLVSLPIWPGMSDADVMDTVRAVQKVVAAYRK
jgi:UDP-4-amino-4,6-dideoxy-N-acetyl-beta-L-altrosamine transaminase